MERREFIITTAGAAAASPLLSHPALASALGAGDGRRPPALANPKGAVGPEDGPFWKSVRAQFPLATDRIYLNTGALGASPYAVIDAVRAKTDELEAACEAGHSDELWKEIKTSAASLLGCDADELAFTRNATEGINIVANGLALEAGDEVIMSTQEHVGNAVTWVGLQQRSGIALKLFEPSTLSGDETCARIRQLITTRTKVISIPHILATTGTIMPVKEVAAIARERGVFFFVDGAQACGMMPSDLHEIGCDAYAASGHKWLMGPKETGFLYVRRDRLDRVRAKFIGAYSNERFDLRSGALTLHPSAQRYEYGTVSVPLRVGLAAAVRFIQTIGIENIWQRDRALAAALHEGLTREAHLAVLSPSDPSLRSAMVTIAHRSLSASQLQEKLNRANLRTRIVYEGGLDGLRLSLHCYNSFDEVGRALAAVHSVR